MLKDNQNGRRGKDKRNWAGLRVRGTKERADKLPLNHGVGQRMVSLLSPPGQGPKIAE